MLATDDREGLAVTIGASARPYCRGRIRALRNAAYRTMGRTRDEDQLRGAVYLAGSPRSGTTWLHEILTDLENLVAVHEPLSPGLPESSTLGITYRTYRRADASDPALQSFLRNLLLGSHLTTQLLPPTATAHLRLLRGRPVGVKCIRSNLLLPFLRRQVPGPRILLLVRNPRAVIASQLLHGTEAWRQATSLGEFYRPVLDDWPDLEPPPLPTRPAAVLAAHWAIEHAYLERCRDDLAGVTVVRYEDMFRDPAPVVAAVAGLPPDELSRRVDLRRPSRSVQESSALRHGGDPRSEYERALSVRDRDDIEAVLAHYGHPFGSAP